MMSVKVLVMGYNQFQDQCGFMANSKACMGLERHGFRISSRIGMGSEPVSLNVSLGVKKSVARILKI